MKLLTQRNRILAVDHGDKEAAGRREEDGAGGGGRKSRQIGSCVDSSHRPGSV